MVTDIPRIAARRYTVKEAAHLIGVHVQTLRRAINEGRVPVVQIGGRYCVPESSLELLLTPHTLNANMRATA